MYLCMYVCMYACIVTIIIYAEMQRFFKLIRFTFFLSDIHTFELHPICRSAQDQLTDQNHFTLMTITAGYIWSVHQYMWSLDLNQWMYFKMKYLWCRRTRAWQNTNLTKSKNVGKNERICCWSEHQYPRNRRIVRGYIRQLRSEEYFIRRCQIDNSKQIETPSPIQC